MNTWLILGAGGHGHFVADAIRACGDAVLGFLEDDVPPTEFMAGVPVLGSLQRPGNGPSSPLFRLTSAALPITCLID